MAKQKKKRIDTSGTGTQALGSLGNLFEAAGFQGEKIDELPSPSLDAQPASVVEQDTLPHQKGLHLHVERKGRHGKTVTIVSKFHMSSTNLKQTARSMAKALGCGATVEQTEQGGQIVLQGNNLDRARKWLQDADVQLRVPKKK